MRLQISINILPFFIFSDLYFVHMYMYIRIYYAIIIFVLDNL